MAALVYTTCPFWMVGIDAILPAGRKPVTSTIGGLLLGLAGVLFLIIPSALKEGSHGAAVTGFLVLQLSAAGWVLGALLQKRVAVKAQPLVSGAIQQLAAGLAMFIPATIFEHVPAVISARSGWAVAYLVLFGSVIGFSSFIYSMARLPVAIVSVYTFVNPIVAVFLGFLFFREPFGFRELIAMLIIFAGIAAVKWSESRHEHRSRQRAKNLGEMEVVGQEP